MQIPVAHSSEGEEVKYLDSPESLDLKVQMEPASLHPSLPGEADPSLHVNGAEVEISKAPPTGRHQGQREAPEEEADQWETTVGPVYTMTRTAAALSFATVQWDGPDTPPGRGGRPHASHPDFVDEEEEQEVIAGLEDCPSLRPFRDVPSTRPALPDNSLPPDSGDICRSCDAAVEEQEVEHPERLSWCVGDDLTRPDVQHMEEEEQEEEEGEEMVPGQRGAEEIFLSTLTGGSGHAPPSSSPFNSVEGEEDDDHHCDEERGHPKAVDAVLVCLGDVEALGKPAQTDGDGELSEALWSNETLCSCPGGVAPEEPQESALAAAPCLGLQEESEELTSSAPQTVAGIEPSAQRLTSAQASEFNPPGGGGQPEPPRPPAEFHPRREQTSLDVRPAETEPSRPGEGDGLGGGGGVRTSVSSGPESQHATQRVLRPRTPEPSGAESHDTAARWASVEPATDQSQCSVSSRDPPQVNGGGADRLAARRLAHRLFHLEDTQRVDVVQHMDKDTEFSRAVGEEFLCFFDFSGQTLDNALRSFLTEVVLVGESQERERVLQHFSTRFHHCNPDVFSSPGAVLTLTCAMMLLNTDLHGQNVGKAMSTSSFISNMEGMNEGENFNKDLLRSFYNSIRGEPLQWAVDEEELKKQSMPQGEDLKEDSTLRSKSNPFQDVPHDRTARVFKQGFLQRKAHADIDGKRTPWGKRSWKTFYGVLRGLVLYFQKDAHRKCMPGEEEVVSLHHALAQEASDYTKKPHVFRLQTADWRVFLFQASSRAEMSSWICRINLVAALHSSPPFPAAVGSQRRFTRPLLPASRSAHTLERQLTSHSSMLESFEKDLHLLQEQSDGRKPRGREVEEQRVREEYLLHERSRYQGYLAVLDAWRDLNLLDGSTAGDDQLRLLDRAMFRNFLEDIEEESEGLGMKKSVSSPSLELETVPPVVKVRRNVSERRTYRRNIIARRNKDL